MDRVCEICGNRLKPHQQRFCSKKHYGIWVSKNRTIWTDEETEILRKHYRHSPKEKILDLLPNWTWEKIRHKASLLGIAESRKRWTPEEIRILEEHYPMESWDGLVELLPGKSEGSIQSRAYRHRVHRENAVVPWSEEEFAILKNSFEVVSKDEMIELLPRRTWGAIKAKGSLLGFYSRFWKDEEIEILKEHYRKSSREEILTLLPRRDWQSVVGKASMMKVRRCTMRKPTNIEVKLQSLLTEFFSGQWRYVGNFKFWIGKPRKNPDFAHVDRKLLIEVMGNYYHSSLYGQRIPVTRTQEFLEEHYRSYGYKTLFIWQDELESDGWEERVRKRITSFVDN